MPEGYSEADYRRQCLLCSGINGTQISLHDDVRLYFETEKTAQKSATHDKGHGRVEKREYYLETEIDWLCQKPDRTDLAAIAVKSSVWEKDALREGTRYFITSLTDVKTFTKAVRTHWGIENSLHYCLDVTFHEDACRTRKDNSAENFSVIRKIALNILKNHPAKMSLARKRRKCEDDSDFMADVPLSVF